MSTLSRYVMKETASHATAGLLVVLGVFLVTRLSTLLNDAAVGSLPGGVVLELLALRTVMALPSLLPAVLYLGVLLGLSRLARDAEIVAVQACGIAPSRLHAAVLVLAVGAAGGIAVLSFAVRPWAAARFNAVRDRAVAQSGLENLTPGTFVEVDTEQHDVLFAESRSPSDPQQLENVFVQQRTERGITIFIAKYAVESRDQAAGFRFLTLFDGVSYDLSDSEHQEITRYAQFTLRAPIPAPEPDLGPEKTLSVWALLDNDDLKVQAELQWRCAMPVSALLLALLAIPLTPTEPRRGRYANLLPAVLLYIVYRSLLGTARNWVAAGTLPPLPGVWLVHMVCLLLTLCFLAGPRSVWGGRGPRLLTSAAS